MTEQFSTVQVDYTSRDFDSIVTDLINKIPFFLPEWTDHNPSDPGITLLELFAYVGDGLHYYIDRAANEGFIDTAVKRESVIALLKLIDYIPASAVPASVDLTFSIQSVLPGPLLIPKGTQVQTASVSDPVFFETDADLTIPSGQLSGTVGATEGQSFDENLDPSDGRAYQTRELVNHPLIDGTLRLYIDEGTGEQLWEKQESLFLSSPIDKHFFTQVDADDITDIFFGDGANGKIPLLSASMRATGRFGGGLRGNVGAGEITQVNSVIYFLGSPVTVQVVNSNAASGGGDRESTEEAKFLGPQSLRALGRAVTLDDYKFLSEAYPGVGKAKAVPHRELGEVWVYIVPDGGGLPSSTLKTNLATYLMTINCAGVGVVGQDPTEVTVDISGTVHVLSNFTNAGVEATVLAALDDFFDVTLADGPDLGKNIALSDVYRLIDEQEGVDYVDLTKLTFRPIVVYAVWSGGATFSAVSISSTTKRETWTISFNSPTTFNVSGSTSGPQVATGTLDVPYVSDGAEVSFLITSGGGPPAIGDRATFKTSPLVGNIVIEDTEIAKKGSIALVFTGGA